MSSPGGGGPTCWGLASGGPAWACRPGEGLRFCGGQPGPSQIPESARLISNGGMFTPSSSLTSNTVLEKDKTSLGWKESGDLLSFRMT